MKKDSLRNNFSFYKKEKLIPLKDNKLSETFIYDVNCPLYRIKITPFFL